jgi:phosphoribosylformimino-5-aminoimidazole carboxamide ribonucleotide (ProFAR) isomerase
MLVTALKEHESYIAQETLATSINANGETDGVDIDLGELTAKVKIERK